MPVILSTKILDSKQREKIISHGFSLLEHDFISVENTFFQIENTAYEYLIFTSKNAVKSVYQSSFFEILRHKKTLCVGEKTKELLEKCGWQVLECYDYVELLGEIITQKYAQNSFIFFCGNLRRDTLPDILKKSNIEYSEIQVYTTHKTPTKISKPFDAVLFFSPSGVESFFKKNTISSESVFCIGTTTADFFGKYSKYYHIANQPTIDSTIHHCINHLKSNIC